MEIKKKLTLSFLFLPLLVLLIFAQEPLDLDKNISDKEVIKKLIEENQRLTNQLKKLSVDKEVYSQETTSDMKGMKIFLETQINSLIEDKGILLRERKRLNEQLNDNQDKMDALALRLKDFQAEFDRLKLAVRQKDHRLSDLLSEKEKTTETMKSLTIERQGLKKENLLLKTKIDALERFINSRLSSEKIVEENGRN
ncbi:MAG: hypothetical protein PHV17_00980 [Candidatus Omnitrophica bacterium]|nr:hypothetical protein [Candidatus Omnitrophota bacterium]